jgi:ADP-ribose pyrophosphatase YjhB (NUDIX family)
MESSIRFLTFGSASNLYFLMEYKWLDVVKRLQAIAQAGLTYAENGYDQERYEQLRQITVEIMADLTHTDTPTVEKLFANETGYQTPKVDVRAVVFEEGKLLMVRETIDGCWTLPGGWADVGLTPAEVAVKEAREESGLEVEPVRLLAVLDKKCHPHPPSPYHTYKIFILCRATGGALGTSHETSDSGFFDRHQLPPLSAKRITASQISLLYEFHDHPGKDVVFD